MLKSFFYENRAIYEIIWKKYCRPRQAIDANIIWRMRFALWISKATGIHSEYVILFACTRQKWLRERALMLRLDLHCICCYITPYDYPLGPKYLSIKKIILFFNKL